MASWQILLIGLPVFLLAITLHELAHGWVADRLGDATAREQGRLTLNPLAHLDPLGTLFFVLSAVSGIGFGWAKPVPVDMARLGARPFQKMVLIAAAGPASNLLQGACWYGLLQGLLALGGVGLLESVPEFLFILCVQGVVVNLLLMLFNLVPIPPLDGSRIVGGVMPVELAARWYQLGGLGFLLLLLFLRSPFYDMLVGRPLHWILDRLFMGLG